MKTSSLTFSQRESRPVTPLTQYGRMAEKHWREHLPKMVRELERKGLLHQMLLEAEEKTKDEMARLRTELMKQGPTAQQAHTQAWEMVREKYLLLPPEE
jgi:glucose-6-phosphate-specific signal transduction histidine kinase